MNLQNLYAMKINNVIDLLTLEPHLPFDGINHYHYKFVKYNQNIYELTAVIVLVKSTYVYIFECRIWFLDYFLRKNSKYFNM